MSRREKPKRDVRPLSDLGTAASEAIREVQESGRPLVLTEAGEAQAVVLSATDYAQMLDTIDLLNDIVVSLGEAEDGQVYSNDEAKAEVLRRLGR